MLGLLRVRNFISHPDTTIQLANQGLVLLEAEIRGRASATSNGGGKSTLVPDGPAFALFGRTFRGATGEKLVNRAAGRDCLVEQELLLPNGTRALVARPVKHRKHPRPWVTIGTETYTGAAEVDRVISMLLGGMSFETFGTSVVFRRTGFFTQMTDAQRKDCLEELAGMQVITRASALAKQEAQATAAALQQATHAHALAQQALTMAEGHLQKLRLQAERFARERDDRLATIAGNKRAAEEARTADEMQLVVARQEVMDLDAAVMKAKATRDALTLMQTPLQLQLAEIQKRFQRAQFEEDTLRTKIADIEGLPDTCPTCGQGVDQSISLAQLPALREDLAAATAVREVVGMELPAIEAGITSLREACGTADSVWTRTVHASQEANNVARGLEINIRCANDAIARCDADARTLTEAGAVDEQEVEAAAFAMDERFATVQQAAEAIQLAAEEASYSEFWIQGYGQTGVKARLLGEEIPALNRRTPLYAQLLTDNEIGVRFTDSITLKTGDERSKFDVVCSAVDGGEDYTQLSDGQRRRADLIATLALADRAQSRLAAPINLLVFDELFDSLDRGGIERTIGLLQMMSQRKGSIFVTSHTQGFSEYFPKTIRVIYENGLSHIEQ